MTDSHAHIYFLVHEAHERFKVGIAKHPLQRWAQIQHHDHTDFRESLVFDVAPGVSHRWVERTLHRAIVDARVDMPGSVVGYTEWFDYQAYDSVRRFAADHRDLLGLGDGYTLAKPSRPQHTPAAGNAVAHVQDGNPRFPTMRWRGTTKPRPSSNSGHNAF
ncbi:GIY-YIG nuclease family protein [Microbacterium sp. NPDC089318]